MKGAWQQREKDDWEQWYGYEKANQTETHVLAACCPEVVSDYNDFAVFDFILLLNSLAQIYPPKNNPPVPMRGI